MGLDRYIEGFLAGQAAAYCERVNTGASLAAQLVCANDYVEELTNLIAAERCLFQVMPHEYGRTSLWIYRDESVEPLILALRSGEVPPELAQWSTGKLFGYGSQDVLASIDGSRSAYAEESSPLPSSDIVY